MLSRPPGRSARTLASGERSAVGATSAGASDHQLLPPNAGQTEAPTLSTVLRLQRLVGNQTTQRLLQAGLVPNATLRAANAHGAQVQRYESGEHAQLGETQTELQKAFAPSSYVVQKGDRLGMLATRFGLSVDELGAANKGKLKTWSAADGSDHMVKGFNAGETITVPKQLNELAKSAVADPSAKFAVNGVVLDYGVGIAMGDFFESPAEMAKAPPAQLRQLAQLIKDEQAGKPVRTEDWQKATHGRYLELATQNVTHFAPSNSAITTPTAAGRAAPNHKTEWEKHHLGALQASQAGDKDKALLTNAFADHFLTDAFSAGHLINKPDVMERFKQELKLDAKGKEFLPDAKAFFDDVATQAFTGDVKKEFSEYETYDAYTLGWHPDIDSVSRFSTLLQGIHKERPDLVANAVAKATHDRLNRRPGGVVVENAHGDPPWKLSGDGTLNAATKAIAEQAVAQSQLNVIQSFRLVGPLDAPTLFKRVWDYTPRPSPEGMKLVVAEVTKMTDVKDPVLQAAVVDLIRANYLMIISELVKLKKLKRA